MITLMLSFLLAQSFSNLPCPPDMTSVLKGTIHQCVSCTLPGRALRFLGGFWACPMIPYVAPDIGPLFINGNPTCNSNEMLVYVNNDGRFVCRLGTVPPPVPTPTPTPVPPSPTPIPVPTPVPPSPSPTPIPPSPSPSSLTIISPVLIGCLVALPSDPPMCTPGETLVTVGIPAIAPMYFNSTTHRIRYCSGMNQWSDL